MSSRRKGPENSEVRTQLLNAAAELIAKEGWSAVTAGRVAEKIGLSRYIVHYYFGTTEDLLVALIKREGEWRRQSIIGVLGSGEPLRVIWELMNDTSTTEKELTAVALRKKKVQIVVRHYIEEFHKLARQALERFLEARQIKPAIPPAVSAALMISVSQTLAVESALGASEGHPETKGFIEDWLRSFAENGGLPVEGACEADDTQKRAKPKRQTRRPSHLRLS